MLSILKGGRVIVWATFVFIQVTFFGQYYVSSKAASRQELCVFHSRSTSTRTTTPGSQPLLSPSSIDCQRQQLSRGSTLIAALSPNATLALQDLSPTSGTEYKLLKYRAPAVYPNVNYTLVETRLARPFPVWTNPFPCYPTEEDWYTIKRQKSPTKRGFFYFKARKAGSSTLAGVALRIARTKAHQVDLAATSHNATHCHTRYGHPAAHRLHYSGRDRAHSYLWSIIREPTQRDISEFFHFGVSRAGKMEPSRQAFQSYLQWTPLMHEYYLQFMPTNKAYMVEDAAAGKGPHYVTVVAKIMTDYDFIGITERMHESLVALQLLLDLNTSDILFLSAKTSGGWDDGLSNGQCYYIHPPVVSPQLVEYLQSSDWMDKTKGGNLLYVAANRSLDLTIASFDQTDFQQKLKRYKWALEEAQRRCQEKVRFPCSAGGVLQKQNDCLIWDSGCGFDCLDRVAIELGL